MKFHLAINLERVDETTSMTAVRDHTIDMVKMADKAGFEVAWAAEHHALEMTIAPNPFQLLTWWAAHTEKIRLGCGVANAAYWHPINLAGEAAMVDVLSGGRLELGLGSGAYQREFDRMCPGVSQKEYWQFPKATACPKPLQDKVPMWVAARSPGTFDYAVANDCNVMCWPLSMPMAEADKYKALLDEAIAKQGGWNGTFALMRHTAVYDNADDRATTLSAVRNALGRFGNLMMKKGDVVNGFPDVVPLAELDGNARVDPAMLEENLVFGSPEQVIAKLKSYEALDVDSFIYYASMGLDMDVQKRSMSLFINEVMPEFA
jgi:alkanesulfonate monooxygenase SsuD/methylene tetrahydromethanopterin reductase-like flavin-dependent oxidoreductase (luciferase family)